MKSTPRLAIAVLERLGAADSALLGDVSEEYRHGRSVVWLWWQVIVTVAIAVWRDIGQHKMLAVRAGVIGFAATWFAYTFMATPLSAWVRDWAMDQLFVLHESYPAIRSFAPFAVLYAIDLTSYVPIAAGYLFGGWVVGRLHRRHAGGLAAFAVVVLSAEFVRLMDIALTPIRTPSGEMGFPYPVLFVSLYTLMPLLFILLGGVWGIGNIGADRGTTTPPPHGKY